MNNHNRHTPFPKRFKKLTVFAAGVVFLFCFAFNYDAQIPEPQQPEGQNEITISFAEKAESPKPLSGTPQKLSFEEYCRRNPISICWNQQKPEDFLYREDADAPTAVLKSEEFVPNLLDESADIETTYEEELPEDIIEASDVYTSKIYSLHIVPERKPPHFETPTIAVVIDDMGISLKRTADIISLQAPLTSSFLTYGRRLSEQVENARRSGHEIMIHIPMEAKSNIDEAPDVLTTAMNKEEIKHKLQIMLNKFDNVKGVNNHMGSKLTEDKERMNVVMQVLHENNLFFLDSKTSAASQAEDAAAANGVAYAHRHVFIDNNNDKTYILGQLKKAENIALKNGYAIAIGHPKTQTYAALKEWLSSIDNKNLHLVQLSRIIEILNHRKLN